MGRFRDTYNDPRNPVEVELFSHVIFFWSTLIKGVKNIYCRFYHIDMLLLLLLLLCSLFYPLFYFAGLGIRLCVTAPQSVD